MTRRLLLLAALALVPLARAAVERELRRVVDQRRRARSRPPRTSTRSPSRSTDPGTPRSGTRRADRDRERRTAGSRASRFQVAPAGGSTWTDACVGDDRAVHLRLGHDRRTTGSSTSAPSPATPPATSARAARAARRRQHAPAVTLADPGGHAQGHRRRSPSTATDAGAGLAADGVIDRVPAVRRRHAGSRSAAARALGHVRVGHRRGSPTATTTCARAPPTRSATPRPPASLADRHVDNSAADAGDPRPAAARHARGDGHDDRSTPPTRRQRRPEGRLRGAPDGHAHVVRRCATDTAAPYTCSANSGRLRRARRRVRDPRRHLRRRGQLDAVGRRHVPDRQHRADGRRRPPPILAGHRRRSRRPPTRRQRRASPRVRIERRTPDNGQRWTTLCTDTVAPFTCDWAVPAADQPVGPARASPPTAAGNASDVAASPTAPAAPGPPRSRRPGRQRRRRGDARRRRRVHVHLQRGRAPRIVARGLGRHRRARPSPIRVADGGARDTLTVWNAANTAPTGARRRASRSTATSSAAAGAPLAGDARRARAPQATLTARRARRRRGRRPRPAPATLAWTPSTAALDATGLPALATPVTESGTGDADL